MQYSPKLKKAMEEIKEVIKKYDVGAVVVIHTPGHSEYLNSLSPTYSCITQIGDELRIRAKAADFGGDAKARDKKLADTSNMLHLLFTTSGRESLAIGEVSRQLDKILGADHFGDSHSSHTEQNQ